MQHLIFWSSKFLNNLKFFKVGVKGRKYLILERLREWTELFTRIILRLISKGRDKNIFYNERDKKIFRI